MPRTPAAILAVLCAAVVAVVAITTAFADGPLDTTSVYPPPAPRVAAPAAPADTGLADSLAAAPAGPRDYVGELRANFTPANRTYARIRQTLSFAAPLYALFVAAVLLFSGGSARIRARIEGLVQSGYVRAMLYVTLYFVTVTVLSLPFDVYRDWALERQFGLSTQSFGAWVTDHGKSLAYLIVLYGIVPVVWGALAVVRRSPRFAWAWLGVLGLPLSIALVWLAPLFVDPAFNRFTPLEDYDLRVGLRDLTARAGIAGAQTFQVDKSRQTKKVNAYVTGFGGSHRVVLWDTLIRQMKRDEVLFVSAHEIGHYRLGHVFQGILLSSAGSLAFLLVYFALARASLGRWGSDWGVRGLDDLAALPLHFALLGALTFATAPITNAVSRSMEHDADVYALEITRDNDAGARTFLALARENRSDPDPAPLARWFLWTHPPLLDRVRFAIAYRPWEEGKPNRLYRGPEAGAAAGR